MAEYLLIICIEAGKSLGQRVLEVASGVVLEKIHSKLAEKEQTLLVKAIRSIIQDDVMKLQNVIAELAVDDYNTCKFHFEEGLTYLAAHDDLESNISPAEAKNVETRFKNCKKSFEIAKYHAVKVISYPKLVSVEAKLAAFRILLFCHTFENTVENRADHKIIVELWIKDLQALAESLKDEKTVQTKIDEISEMMINTAIAGGFGYELWSQWTKIPSYDIVWNRIPGIKVSRKTKHVVKFVNYGSKWFLNNKKTCIIRPDGNDKIEMISRYFPDQRLTECCIGKDQYSILASSISSICENFDCIYFVTENQKLYRFRPTETQDSIQNLQGFHGDNVVLVQNFSKPEKSFLITQTLDSISFYHFDQETNFMLCKPNDNVVVKSVGMITAAEAWTDPASEATHLLLLRLNPDQSTNWELVHIDEKKNIVGVTENKYTSKQQSLKLKPQAIGFTKLGHAMVVYCLRDSNTCFLEIAIFDRIKGLKIDSDGWKFRKFEGLQNIAIIDATILIANNAIPSSSPAGVLPLMQAQSKVK